jgi:hypothetical protein
VTPPLSDKSRRLHAIERQLAALVKRFDAERVETLRVRVDYALQTATVSRLMGENDALRRNEALLRKRIAEQGAELFSLKTRKP